jgi:hemerythrin superfamily protein
LPCYALPQPGQRNVHRFEKATADSRITDPTELVGAIINELGVHTTIEEETFYPAVRELTDQLADVVAEGIQEHHTVNVLADEIAGVEAGSEEWAAKMAVPMESVSHHVEEEENDMLPEVRSATDAAWPSDMAERLETQKKQLRAVADKMRLSAAELTQLAKNQQIPGRSSMNHDELAASVTI